MPEVFSTCERQLIQAIRDQQNVINYGEDSNFVHVEKRTNK